MKKCMKILHIIFMSLLIGTINTSIHAISYRQMPAQAAKKCRLFTVWFDAVADLNVDAIEQLLAEDAEINAKKYPGHTALYVVTCLIDAQGDQQLSQKQIDVARVLLDSGAHPNFAFQDRMTVLMATHNPGVVKLL